MPIQWNAASNAASYNVNLSSNGGWSWSRAKTGATGVSLTVNTAVWSGFNSGATYIASARAVNANGNGSWKNSAPSSP